MSEFSAMQSKFLNFNDQLGGSSSRSFFIANQSILIIFIVSSNDFEIQSLLISHRTMKLEELISFDEERRNPQSLRRNFHQGSKKTELDSGLFTDIFTSSSINKLSFLSLVNS